MSRTRQRSNSRQREPSRPERGAARGRGRKPADKRRSQRLTRAESNPAQALENGWFQDPDFCRGFFDRCEHQALVASTAAVELARRAIEIADSNGDPHLVNRGHGVLTHAFIARYDLFWAGKELEAYHDRALGCCPWCRSDFLRRQGDLLGELRKPDEALEALNLCLEELGSQVEPDGLGRTCFLRGIAHHQRGERGRALGDAGSTLAHTALDGPRGIFLDTPALIAIYVGGGDPRHDALALELLESFEERIRGREGWKEVRTRILWVKGHLYARLGDMRRARLCLEAAQARLIAEGLAREAVAITLDLAMLRCRHWQPRGENEKMAQRAITRCLVRTDLRQEHREGLEHLRDDVLEDYPEDSFAELEALRRSFIAPVPGVLAERVRVL